MLQGPPFFQHHKALQGVVLAERGIPAEVPLPETADTDPLSHPLINIDLNARLAAGRGTPGTLGTARGLGTPPHTD